jgi:hypothetical protein
MRYAVLLVCLFVLPISYAAPGELRAGAAAVSITPPHWYLHKFPRSVGAQCL